MSAPSLAKKTMLEAFDQKAKPTKFLSSWFPTTERDIVDTDTVDIDIKRGNEKIAIDVSKYVGETRNSNNQFTSKEFTPPAYNEYFSYVGKQLQKRLPGRTEYDKISPMAQLLAIITDDQVKGQDKITRAIEVMCSTALLTGTIILINNVSVDYKQKSTHDFDAAIDWDEVSTATPWVELDKACDLNRKDGKGISEVGIFGSNSLQWLLAATKMQNRLNLRHAELANIKSSMMNDEGAVFHGLLDTGNYTLQVWTYPQYYDIPTDAELGLPSGTVTNAGTTQLYIPTDKVIVLPEPGKIDMRTVYAGISRIVNPVEPEFQALGITGVPDNARGKWHPYAHTDQRRKSLIVGVESAPLPIPVDIDRVCAFDAKAT